MTVRYSGIGLESSILFASEGACVVLADINVQSAEHTASHIAKLYPNAKTLVLKTDVGKEADIKRLVEATVKTFGRLDVMVSRSVRLCVMRDHLLITISQFNNAGTFHDFRVISNL
jgi:NAD(P)-dependent dehydrogenase (short-subunit alcohol dehydrogenase family)